MFECMRNAAREHMTLDEQISFCEEKSKNIKLKTKPQTFIDIKNSLEKLKNPWIPVSERLPDVDEYIIVSFENFSVPMIGRYTVDDDDSGTFRIGDEDESFVENDLYVIAWMPLPEPYRESEDANVHECD